MLYLDQDRLAEPDIIPGILWEYPEAFTKPEHENLIQQKKCDFTEWKEQISELGGDKCHLKFGKQGQKGKKYRKIAPSLYKYLHLAFNQLYS